MTTLERVRAEIQKVLDKERDFTSENAKAQAIALNWCIKIIDRYMEQEPCDVVSRQAVEKIINDIRDCISVEGYWAILERLKKLPSVRPQEPCTDSVSRRAVLETINNNTADERDGWLCIDNDLVHEIEKLPSVRPQEQKSKQFAEWVAREIFDEMWEYNKDAFAEIACRKLAKLGIVREKGDVWELVEQKESEG